MFFVPLQCRKGKPLKGSRVVLCSALVKRPLLFPGRIIVSQPVANHYPFTFMTHSHTHSALADKSTHTLILSPNYIRLSAYFAGHVTPSFPEPALFFDSYQANKHKMRPGHCLV